jgi:phytoene synthase
VLDGGAAQRDAQLQRLRLRWWRDAVEGALGGDGDGGVAPRAASQPSSAQPPSLAALAAVFEPTKAATPHVRRLLGHLLLAREADAGLKGCPPPSREALLHYCRSTGGALLGALMHVTDGGSCSEVQAAAADAGAAMSLASLLRGSLAHASRGRLYVPADMALKEGLSANALLRPDGGGAPARAVFSSLAADAEQLLMLSRAARRVLSREQRLVLLPALPAGRYLAALRAADYDAAALGRSSSRDGGAWAGESPTAMHLRLAWAAATEKY